MVEMTLTGTLMWYFPTGRLVGERGRKCVFIVSSLVEAARVCAGLRLIRARLEDYGNNRLPLTDCWVPSQPKGGRAADAYHCVAVGDSSHSHMTGDTLIHTAAGQRTAQRFYHQTRTNMTTRPCMLIVLKAQMIVSVVSSVTVFESEGLWPADMISNNQ